LKRINARAFSNDVRNYLRAVDSFQKELANELGLHPKVLSRKLNNNGDAHLTAEEVRRIIAALARWEAITTYDEALHLLELAGMEPDSFSDQEWETAPLSQLAGRGVARGTQADYPLRHNLPASLTRLVGRAEAVEQLRQLLGQDEVRLVTLVGPGGSGKTRLALHVAHELIHTFARGVWFVSLAAVRDAAVVPQRIMQDLGIKATPDLSAVQSLTTYLKDKQLLLLLDNFEQIAEAAGAIGELLAAAPGLKVLVTSRVVLDLYGENEFNVAPLDVPDLDAALDIEKLAQYGAVQLFVERARAVVPDFALTYENAASIAQICARVDGLPLALELAAARVKVLPPGLLLERLSEGRLSLLTGGARNIPDRQRALRKTITWSYDLLSAPEQAWFARMGVFSGGWSLEAAEAMMQAIIEGQSLDLGDTSVPGFRLDMLERLVDTSLLVRLLVVAGQVRFTLLETLREYALERLNIQGELECLRDWHAYYYLGVAEAAEIGLKGAQQIEWQARLVTEQDNFRAALEWSFQRARAGKTISFPPCLPSRSTGETGGTGEASRGEVAPSEPVPHTRLLAVEVCMRLAAALRPYWEWQGQLAEGRGCLEAALAISLEEGVGRTTLAARAKALSEAARLVCLQNVQDRAVALAEESITLWRQLEDPKGLASALFYRGWPAQALGDHELAKSVYQQALQLLSPRNDVWLRAQLLFYLGAVAGFTHDFERMRSYYTQSRELFEQVGDRSAIADVWKDQGGMAILEGNYSEAIANLVKGIRLSHELGHKQFVASGMGLLGFAVGLRGEPDPTSASLHAAKLWAAANNMQQAIGSSPWLGNMSRAQEMILQIRARVDKESWRAAWHAGRSFTEEQAIAACLAYTDSSIFIGIDVLP
jgi:predicted ATPase